MSNLERKRAVADEVGHYHLGRHSSGNEAVLQILDFTVHIKHPTVVCLSLLLENGQHIYVAEDNLHQTVKHYSDSLTFSVHNITLP
jgi:hypothetical protein